MTNLSRRFRTWWAHGGAGSVAFVVIVLGSAFGLFVERKYVTRLARNEAQVAALELGRATDNAERIATAALDSSNAVKQQTLDIAKRQQAVARLTVEIVRKANVEGCKRDNVSRRRVREFANRQLDVSVNTMKEALMPQVSRSEWVTKMAGYDESLKLLIRDLKPTNCERAYPPPDFEFPLEAPK